MINTLSRFFFSHQESYRIRGPILAAFAGMLFVLSSVFIVSVHSLHEVHEEESVFQTRQGVEQLLNHLLQSHTEEMAGLLGVIVRDRALQEVFLRRERAALQQESAEIYRQMGENSISHFYFVDPDGVVVLRMHQPDRFGDHLERQTMRQAMATGATASGLELGPLGTLTLRVVVPWRMGGDIVGYLELGTEITHLINLIRRTADVEAHVFVYKKWLNQARWQQGMTMLGRSGQWDQFADLVWIDEGEQGLSEVWVRTLQQGGFQPAVPPHFLTDHQLYLFIPVSSVSGELVAWLGIAKSDARVEEATRTHFLTTLSVITLATALLLLFLYGLLQRLEERLETATVQLRRNEKRLRAILDTAMDAIVSIDSKGHILEFNPAAEKIFGFSKNEVMGRDIADTIIPPEWRQQHKAGMARYLATGTARVINQTVEQVAVNARGNRLPVDLSITVVDDQDFVFFTAYLRDISERQQMLASLQESYHVLEQTNQKLTLEFGEHRNTLARLQAREAELRSITDSVWDAIIAADHSQRITFWNEGAHLMFGHGGQEAVGQPLSLLVPEQYQADYLEQFERFQEGVQPVPAVSTRELLGRRADGSLFPMEMAVAVWMENGRRRFAAVIRDITGRQQTEKSLREAVAAAEAANQAKSQFLARMSHEIRTPMNAIVGICDLLLDNHSLDREGHHYLRVMKQAGDTLMALINDILDLSKIEAGQMVLEQITFDLADLVTETVAMMQLRAIDKGLALDYQMAAEMPRQYVGDPQRLRQLLLNLLSNAIKFTSAGGVSVRVGQGEAGEVVLEVEDSGIGIAPEMQATIFQPFIQAEMSISRRFGGTGLGLTICKQLVRQMEGEIELESQLDRGTLFRLRLPLPRSKELPGVAEVVSAQPVSLPQEEKRAATILLVDDADDNRLLVRAFLKRSGYDLVEAVNGEESLHKFKEGHFDVVLMDIQMPVMDGFEATRQIRAWESSMGRLPTPIIALTAHAMREDMLQTTEAGCNMHVTKPITKSGLLEAIRSWL
ncbi:MAG: PAS domain S-box protein [Magnetococcales bacterium]|nr:PAS domain S-box protein [Magnetococcales bacterium]